MDTLYIVGKLTERVERLEETKEANTQKILQLAADLKIALDLIDKLSKIVGNHVESQLL